MTYRLSSKDLWVLSFMTFALFIGAGNILFPPMVGLQAGEHDTGANTVFIRGLA